MLVLSLDLFMVALAIVNLSWLIFDTIWRVVELRQMLGWFLPQDWVDGYAVVNQHFFRIDLVFVSIFATEFLLRWAAALWQRQYPYWFAYPILHWYDILGCIPVAGLRWLRILRLVVILRRLQRLGLIDYRHWRIYRFGQRLYDILMEEISDRVVIRVLSGVQTEISASHDMERKVLSEVIAPRQDVIIKALHARLSQLGQRSYRQVRPQVHAFITRSVSKAVNDNREIQLIDRIPLVGGVVGDRLDNAITDIVCRVFDELSGQLDSAEFEMLFHDVGTAVLDSFAEGLSSTGSRDQFSAALNDMLEVIKNQVAERRWLQQATQATTNAD